MSVKQYSRYTYTDILEDSGDVRDEAVRFLGDRIPFRYKERTDNILHQVAQGDSLFTLAGRYFRQLQRPAGLWWIIADYQPTPIHDPTIALSPGSVLVIPSMRTLLEEIFNANRFDEVEF